jgi:hypothetical protein
MNDLTAVAHDRLVARMLAKRDAGERGIICGQYHAVFRDADGNIIREDTFPNLLTTVGKNILLTSLSAASTATNFMGLVTTTSFTAFAAADTMASHGGWVEIGAATTPSMSSVRQTCAWSAPTGTTTSTMALSAGLTFTFTATAGSVQGAFIVTGSGATSVVAATTGTLFSAGSLSGGVQPVVNTNTLTLSYSVALT